MPPRIALCVPLTPMDRDAIIAPLLAHNDWIGMSLEGEEMGIAFEDPPGIIAGGLLGYWRDGWLFIASLAVPEAHRLRGHGRALMSRAEGWVRERGGTGIWLDSYGFQAPAFYLRLGYQEMGRLTEYLPGLDRIWFVKRL